MKGKKNRQAENIVLLPRENPNFFGHEHVVADFYAAYNKGNMPAGWLISGKKGIGKATLAYRLARFMLYHGKKKSGGLFAEERPSTDLSIPQNSPIFSKVNIGSHPDLLVLESGLEDSKSAAGEILVEEARKIGSFLHLTSSETSYRIVIIDSIDDMNANAANSILKLLEEPPANAMFILISHSPGRLLPTIRSRCRHIKIQTPDSISAYKIFNKIAPDVSRDISESLLELASGSPGGAYDLYINHGFAIYENIIAIISQLPKLDVMAIQKLGDNISGKANENSWRIFRILLNKIIIDITKHKALDGSHSSLHKNNLNIKFQPSISMDVEKLVEVWQEINKLLEDVDNVYLDRKAALVRIFGLLKGS